MLASVVFSFVVEASIRMTTVMVLKRGAEIARAAEEEWDKREQDERAPRITLTLEELSLDGRVVMRIDDVSDDLFISPLGDALLERRRRGVATDQVFIVADKRVTFRIVKKTMFTCAQAGFSDISFATAK